MIIRVGVARPNGLISTGPSASDSDTACRNSCSRRFSKPFVSFNLLANSMIRFGSIFASPQDFNLYHRNTNSQARIASRPKIVIFALDKYLPLGINYDHEHAKSATPRSGHRSTSRGQFGSCHVPHDGRSKGHNPEIARGPRRSLRSVSAQSAPQPNLQANPV